jgi:uncharacterized protein (TIRG00374 family)
VLKIKRVTIIVSSRLKKVLGAGFGFSVSAFFVYLILQEMDFEAMASTFQKANLGYLVFAITTLAVGYAIRVLRWQKMLLRELTLPPYKLCAEIFMKSITLNNVFPMRAGDIYRVVTLPDEKTKRALIAASVVFERVLDLAVLIILLAICGLFINTAFSFEGGRKFIQVMSFLGLFIIFIPLWVKLFQYFEKIVLRRFTLPNVIETILTGINAFLASIIRYLTVHVFSKLLILSMVCWLFEAGSYYFVALSLNLDIGLLTVLLITCIGTLSTLIPSSPGYIGTFHFVIILAATNLGVDHSAAGAYAILIHLILWGGTTSVGLCFFLKSNLLKSHNS